MIKTLSISLILFFSFGLQAFVENFNRYNNALGLVIEKENGLNYTCSSVAISPVELLTAAHCLENAKSVKVVLDYNIDSNKTIEVSSYKIHPLYDKSQSLFSFDIAKLKLNKPLKSSIKIYPIKDLVNGKGYLVRVGFGMRERMSSRTIVSPIRTYQKEKGYFIMKDLFSYSGDSGGPVFQVIGSEIFVVGIHSTKEQMMSYNVLIDSVYLY